MNITPLTFFQRLNKQTPFFSKIYPIYNKQCKHMKPLSGKVYNFSINQVHQNNADQKKNISYTCLNLNSNQSICFSVNNLILYIYKDTDSDKFSLHLHNNSAHKITLPL